MGGVAIASRVPVFLPRKSLYFIASMVGSSPGGVLLDAEITQEAFRSSLLEGVIKKISCERGRPPAGKRALKMGSHDMEQLG